MINHEQVVTFPSDDLIDPFLNVVQDDRDYTDCEKLKLLFPNIDDIDVDQFDMAFEVEEMIDGIEQTFYK